MRVVTSVALSFALWCALGCSRGRYDPVSLPVPTDITRIDVTSGDGRVLKQFKTSADIQRILNFLTSHRSGWRYSESGYPTPPVELFFYAGDKRMGTFGAGRYRADCRVPAPGFFESDLSQELYGIGGIGASEDDLKAFLDLLGMPEYSLATDDC